MSHIKTEIEPFAIEHATVATGDEDGRTLHDSTIVVDGLGRIRTVGPSSEVIVPPGYHKIDATGKVVSPGMINGHVHTFSKGKPLDPEGSTPEGQRKAAKLAHSPIGKAAMYANSRSNVMTLLNSGVTTIRTVGDVGYENATLRDRIEAGREVGPRILPSGPMLAIPDGHGAPLLALESTTPEEARRNAETNIDHGATALKIAATGGVTDSQVLGEAGAPQMTIEDMSAICETAHANDIIVAAHAQSREGVFRALKAGVDTIEHGCELDDELIDLFLNNPRSLRGYSALEPTLSAGLPMKFLSQEALHMTDIQMANSVDVVKGMVNGTQQAHRAGIKVGVGTDTAMPFVTQYGTWREMYLLVRFGGFTPAEAFHAGTQVTAEIIGVSDVTGSLEEGKYADLLVLDENPVDNLRTLEHPLLVVAAGHPVWHPHVERFADIDAELDEAYK
ncbi:Imidazolonepropionase [Bifidobacterium bohemicum]|uniref:Amidohydrolase n=1 Tax=Bifidobacterium bohemicum DSM 22767 TaxID=1437606 RepID=A0A086ZJJ4_9BIFI|nr:amidohydrolase family protein [Bifidobacterium bohemicum]KFI46694.1 amidohydrolase [Bifidobacterium bohemicum DSM 22767]SCB79028.1 Imidazolonepropionase [Bifidobacterium bohemicum]